MCSLGGAVLFITFTDDFSRYVTLYSMIKTSEALSKFKQFKTLAENHSGLKIKTLRIDNGSEYVCREFQTVFGNSRNKTTNYSV